MSLRTILCAAVSATACLAFAPPLAAAETSPAPAAREVLPATLEPIRYAITVEPDANGKTFKGEAAITFSVREATSDVAMNAADLTFLSAALNTGAKPEIVLHPEAERVHFRFAAPLAPGEYTLTTAYTGTINETANGLFVGAYKGPGGEARRMLVTQFEPGDARRLAPMWDEPSRKAVFALTAILPEQQNAISNMPAARETAIGGGKKRVEFLPSVKMSSYLLFLGIGDIDRLEGVVGDTRLGIVTKAGDADKGEFALRSTQQLLPYYNDYFGVKYPLPKLDQVAVPGAGGFGAMENWGAILYFEPVLLFDPKFNAIGDQQRIFSVVAHEIAHQWFGNLVTMSWWDDLWLNEGFASWMETKATAVLHPEWNPWLQSIGSQQAAMGLDARSSTHPIVQPVANVNVALQAFDTITYSKGEAVIRMLESFLGEEPFRAGVRAYMAKHAYGNTVTNDLWVELEKASGKPVTQIAQDFTLQGGVPLITVEGSVCRRGRTQISLSQGRFGVDEASRTPQAWRTPITAQLAGSDKRGRLVLSGKGKLSVPGCGGVVLNDDNAGYYRVKYDDASFAALREDFAKLDTGDQLGLLYDAFALGSARQAPIGRYLELARRLPVEADPLATRQVVGALAGLRDLYEGQPGAGAFNSYAAGVLRPMLARVGWEAKAGEEPNTALLRSALIGGLARFGDGETIAEAKRRFAAAEAGTAPLPPALRGPVIGIIGYSADQAAWDVLAAKAANAKTAQEQRQFLGALSGVSDPALAEKSLALFLTDATPKQLTPGLIAGIAGQHPDLAWKFYLAHRAEVDARLDPLQRLDYPPGLASAKATPERIAELKAFAAANLPADGEKSVTEAIAGMENRIRQREVLPELTRWVEANRG